MSPKTTSKQTQPMSHGPTIDDLRTAIARAEGEGVERADMLLRLTFRDVSLLKRSPSVGVDEVSFASGEMRFLGVKVIAAPVPLSRLEAPAEPDAAAPEPAAKPKKATKAKAPSTKTKAKAVAEV